MLELTAPRRRPRVAEALAEAQAYGAGASQAGFYVVTYVPICLCASI